MTADKNAAKANKKVKKEAEAENGKCSVDQTFSCHIEKLVCTSIRATCMSQKCDYHCFIH